MPAGVEITVPLPMPALVTVSVGVTALNVAVTDFAASMVTWQVPVPVQAPLQPPKVDAAAADWLSVTTVPEA
jgi:hypothetical protein